jgi:hypothetical protein
MYFCPYFNTQLKCNIFLLNLSLIIISGVARQSHWPIVGRGSKQFEKPRSKVSYMLMYYWQQSNIESNTLKI